MSTSFTELIEGFIIGIIDSYGAIESRYLSLEDLENYTHEDIWGHRGTLGRWRWDYDKCFQGSVYGSSIDSAQWDDIRAHITKNYEIKWFENGYHDWEDIGEKAKLEEKEA